MVSLEVCNKPQCVEFVRQLKANFNSVGKPCTDFANFVCGNYSHVHKLRNEEVELNNFLIRSERLYEEVEDAIAVGVNKSSPTLKYAEDLYLECNQTGKLRNCFQMKIGKDCAL